MKTKNILVILGGAIYSYLFYQESAGINFVLLNLFLIIGAISLNNNLVKEKAFLAVSGGSLLSSIMIMVYSYQLGIIANVISLSLLTHYHIFPKSSIVIALLNFFYSTISSIQKAQKNEEKQTGHRIFTFQNITIGIICLVITGIFLVIYINSNAIFEAWLSQINWSFISFGWIFFTLFGFYLIFLFFNHTSFDSLLKIDQESTDKLVRNRALSTVTNLYKGLRMEFKAGMLLLSLLNFLLLFVNLSDLQFFITQKLPEGASFTSFLHQGVYSLILSILFAIAIILFFFRRNLNFYKKNKVLKLLTYVWLIQNFLLVISIFFKNSIYITDSGLLTYKRIGVFIYLLLTCIGLIITFLKVYQVQSNWFLIRKVSWAFYAILIVSTLIDWDGLIAKHNLPNKHVTYLLELSPNAYKAILEQQKNVEETELFVAEAKIKDYVLSFNEKSWCSWNLTYNNLKSR